MAASSIPIYASSTSTRAQSRAGGWIASTNESPSDSSTTTSTLTGPFCCNQQYSVTAATTSTGTIAERYAYTAYGQPTILNASGAVISATTLPNRYSYTGREWDAAVGLHHFRARWMSPNAGRFLGRDPIGFEDGANLYENYFHVLAMDPSVLSLNCPIPAPCPQFHPGQHLWYGCHCGEGNGVVGPNANNPAGTPAIDPVDNCCIAHATEYVNNNCAAFHPIFPPQGRPPACDDADKKFCRCMKTANCNRHGSGSIEYARCETYRRNAINAFLCEGRFGIGPPKPPMPPRIPRRRAAP